MPFGYTARETIALSQRLLANEVQGCARFAPMHDRIDPARIAVTTKLPSAERGNVSTEG